MCFHINVVQMVSEPILTHDEYADTQTQKLYMSRRIPVVHTKQSVDRDYLSTRDLNPLNGGSRLGNTSRLDNENSLLDESVVVPTNKHKEVVNPGNTLLFPPRFRFIDSKEERMKRINIWNSYLDVTPNVDPLKAVFSRHCDNHLKQSAYKSNAATTLLNESKDGSLTMGGPSSVGNTYRSQIGAPPSNRLKPLFRNKPINDRLDTSASID